MIIINITNVFTETFEWCVCVCVCVCVYTHIYTVPSKSIGTVKTKLLCWLWSRDIYKYD